MFLIKLTLKGSRAKQWSTLMPLVRFETSCQAFLKSTACCRHPFLIIQFLFRSQLYPRFLFLVLFPISLKDRLCNLSQFGLFQGLPRRNHYRGGLPLRCLWNLAWRRCCSFLCNCPRRSRESSLKHWTYLALALAHLRRQLVRIAHTAWELF